MTKERIYKVKLTPYRSGLGTIFHRQTKGHSMMSLDGRYRFYVNEEVENPDFWVVQSKGLRQEQTVNVAKENTILLSTEPRSVLVYPRSYTSQFGMVCTCQVKTKHPNVRLTPPILPWFLGYTYISEGNYTFSQDYDSLKNNPAPEKTKLLSVITSNKAFTQGHVDRIRFVQQLKEHYGDELDVFGEGFHDFGDKWDVLAPYKYHIVIENSSEPYYWTEKLGDCFLAKTFPFYYGCKNVDDFFPRQAYEPIDIHRPKDAIQIIDQQISLHRYEQSIDALELCKQKMLDEWNMFEFIAHLCDTLNPDAPKTPITLHPCHSMDDWHNFLNYTLKRNYFKLKQKLRGNQNL